MSIVYDEKLRCFHLSNARVSYIFRLAGGLYPLHVYWGARVRRVRDDLLADCTLNRYTDETFSLHEFPLDFLPQECPAFGVSDLREGALHVVHADGTHALDLRYAGHEVAKGKPELAGLPSARGDGAETLRLTLRDEKSGIAVELLYTVYEDIDIIARSMRVINGGGTDVTVERAMSACVDFRRDDLSLVTLNGAWGRERRPHVRPLAPGEQGVSSARGASSAIASPFMALTAPGVTEERGEVYAFALCYSGSFKATADVSSNYTPRAMIGINPFNFSWRLAPGEKFQTPEAYLCFSENGMGGMSREFHRLVHRYITTGRYANAPRPILVNNWEATYFGFDEGKLLELAATAKRAGIDMLVLDDGWFGRRDMDNCSLGDWTDDLRKLPNGLAGLGEKLHEMGMKFGLWVEPEMVSPDSELYRAHPDWCIHAGDRIRVEARHQLVLDFSREDVRDYIVESISAAMARGNVDYVKWDMNRNISMYGSEELPAARVKELGHRYILGVYDVMRRIVARFPNVLFESCASGGGRFDLGLFTLMPQAWCSDDTDAWMRCRIQHGTSYVFPPSCIGAHVSAVPNHQTGRVSPLATRAMVAMGGTYGYELDLNKLPEEEIEQIRALNEIERRWQDVLYYGDYYRLKSPFEGDECAFMSVSPDRERAVVTHVFGQTEANVRHCALRLCGLEPNWDYRDEETGRVWGGDELMHSGLPLKNPWGDYAGEQFRLVRVK